MGGSGPSLVRLIREQTDSVRAALPSHLAPNAEAYVRSALTLVRQTPRLLECDAATVLGGIMTASQLGLQFGPLGQAYLVPYRDKRGGMSAQFIIGYQGLVQLAYRSIPDFAIEAGVVHMGDKFEYVYGTEPRLYHEPCVDPGRFVAAWVLAHIGSHKIFRVLSKQQVDAHRKHSRAKEGPWFDHYEQMAQKSAMREMKPFLPLTVELERAYSVDGTIRTTAILEEEE